MARISTFKVEVPCDDAVRFEAIKAVLTDLIRGIGNKQMAADPAEGQAALDGEAVAFFTAASVKTFVTREPGKRKVKP